jgi:hypothetical protein
MPIGNLLIMGFWIRNAIVAIVLIGLGVAFFINKDLLLSSDQNEPEAATAQVKTENDPTKSPQKPGSPQKKANAAADGLSNFYAKIYGEKEDRKVRNNVIFLPEPQGDLVEILQAREMMVRPYRKSGP